MSIRWVRPLRRLQWQITLSYIVVTGVAVLTFIAATAALTALTLQPRSGLGSSGYVDKSVIQSMAYNVAPYLAPYLEQSPPDVRDLAYRMASVIDPASPLNDKASVATLSPAGNPGMLIVVGRDNLPVVATSGNQGDSQSILANPQVRSAIASAWQGVRDAEGLAAHLPNARTAAAAPLIAYDGRVIGVALGVYSAPDAVAAAQAEQNKVADVVGATLGQVIPGALLFVFAASVLGTVTGIVISRGLTRRLRRIAGAAHSWSTGDLEVVVHDHSEDEIGQLAHDLNDMAGQLQQYMMARQELAVIEERHRLARDLHDSVKQQLFVMTMLIGAVRSQTQAQPEVVRTLREAEQIGTQAHQELTALIRALRPVALADKPFAGALRELVVSWARSASIAADLHVPADLAPAPDAANALFYVVREALANVGRHSGATAVTVEVRADGEALCLSIADNGHGFDRDHIDGVGLGLTSMGERMGAIGGTLHTESGASGTRVEASCPVIALAGPPEARVSP